MRLKGKAILITAAGQGIGRASALACVREGADVFATEAQNYDAVSRLSEHGTSQTLAVSWVPIEYVKLTLEGLRVDSWRTQRLAYGLSPGQVDHQVQLGVKFMF